MSTPSKNNPEGLDPNTIYSLCANPSPGHRFPISMFPSIIDVNKMIEKGNKVIIIDTE